MHLLLSHLTPTLPILHTYEPSPLTLLNTHSILLLPLSSLLLSLAGPAGLVKAQLVTAEVGNGVFISGAMTKVNGQLALVMDIGDSASVCHVSYVLFSVIQSH